MLNMTTATNQVGKKPTQPTNSRFLATAGDFPPVILCEEHAKIFETMMMANNIPHTIYELDEEDGPYKCHACNLSETIEEATKPQIILPH